jgi:transcriptional regulator GlxA family with amidase domain
VHWEFADMFQARYPRARLTQDLFVVDRGVFTCSGGTAALDLMLHFIREQHGPDLALSVAEQFIHPRIRAQDDRQRMELHARYRINSAKLAEVIRIMEQTVGEPLEIAQIAARVSRSPRQIERLFARNLGVSPSQFYLELRLIQARSLLRDSSQPIRSIAIECGFGSTSHFSAAYKRLHGCTPTSERRPQVSRPIRKTSPAVNHRRGRREKITQPKG